MVLVLEVDQTLDQVTLDQEDQATLDQEDQATLDQEDQEDQATLDLVVKDPYLIFLEPFNLRVLFNLLELFSNPELILQP